MWLANRLKEKTTWLAIFAMAGLFGMNIKPELQDLIINALIAASAIVAFVFDEDKNVNINLPPVEMQAKSESDDDGYVSREVVRTAIKNAIQNREFPKEHDEREGWNG